MSRTRSCFETSKSPEPEDNPPPQKAFKTHGQVSLRFDDSLKMT